MADLGKTLGRFGAHPLRGGIGRDQFRVLLLQVLQFPEQPVVFGIGNDGGVEDVIAVIMVIDGVPEFVDAGCRLFAFGFSRHGTARAGRYVRAGAEYTPP